MTDISQITLDELWQGAPRNRRAFEPAAISHLPRPVQQYLTHAIAPNTPLASAVRLEMVGAIQLGGKWRPFEAEQVIRWDRGLIWQAEVKMGLLTIRGSDRFVDGEGAMCWRLWGLIPIVSARGPDISRSAAGRLRAETMWIPSVLLGEDARWGIREGGQPRAQVAIAGDLAAVNLTIDDSGRVLETEMRRWGNPDGGEYQETSFGARVQAEATFDGYTIPTELRVGWHFGTDRFESHGEFWRATIRSAAYR